MQKLHRCFSRYIHSRLHSISMRLTLYSFFFSEETINDEPCAGRFEGDPAQIQQCTLDLNVTNTLCLLQMRSGDGDGVLKMHDDIIIEYSYLHAKCGFNFLNLFVPQLFLRDIYVSCR